MEAACVHASSMHCVVIKQGCAVAAAAQPNAVCTNTALQKKQRLTMQADDGSDTKNLFAAARCSVQSILHAADCSNELPQLAKAGMPTFSMALCAAGLRGVLPSLPASLPLSGYTCNTRAIWLNMKPRCTPCAQNLTLLQLISTRACYCPWLGRMQP